MVLFGKNEQTWEYKIEVEVPTYTKGGSLRHEWEKWGREGWELVSVVHSNTKDSREREFYFKRPKSYF